MEKENYGLESCDCWGKVNAFLGEKGVRLRSKNTAIAMQGSCLVSVFVLETEREGRKKPLQSQPATVQPGYCGFCGKAYHSDSDSEWETWEREDRNKS